jgi:hypothetical protein
MNDSHDDSLNWRLIDIEPPVLGGVLYHPLCETCRPLEGAELAALADDIKANSLHYPIVTYGDPPKILDGKNRYRGCLKANVPGRWQRFIGTDEQARAFVRSRNLLRRHDNDFLMARSSLALVTTKRGGDRGNQHTGGKPQDLRFASTTVAQAAMIGGVTRSAIEQAARIDSQDTHPMIRRAAELGVIKIGGADRLAAKSREDQQAEVDKWVFDAVRRKEMTPEQRQRAVASRKLAPKVKKEIDPVKQSKLMTVINLASWDVREFVWKKLWAMFGPAMRTRLIEEVIGPDRQAQLGFGDGDEARYSGDIAEDRG